MTRRFVLWLSSILAASVLVGGEPALAADDAKDSATVAAAINKAGRQRMLSQRFAKAYLMIGLDISPQQGQAILKDSLSRFEAQLAELKGVVPNDDVRHALAQLEREWADYKAVLTAAPGFENAKRIYHANEAVQGTAHRLTLAYEKAAPGPPYRLVNIAGRQRMLSQRLAKFYLFQLWGVNVAAAQMEFNFARAEFSSGMHQLYATPHSNPEIKAALEQLDREWVGYREALLAPGDAAAKKRIAAKVMERSERVLEACEKLVSLYEKQAAAGGL